MRSGLNKCVLELVKPGYPWQEVCGDNITWLILRRKIKAPALRVTAIENVLLDAFQWKVQVTNNENHCYSGDLNVTVQYKSGSLEGKELEFPEEAETEEICREAFLRPEKYLTEAKSKVTGNDGTPGCPLHTSFPSLLLEAPTRAEDASGEHASDIMQQQVQFPWRTKVRGLGRSLEPRIMKVHLAKVGIGTMLLEILLKLEVNNQAIEPAQEPKAYRRGSLGEKMLVIQDEAIQEVIGMAQESGFYSGIADEEERNLLIKNTARTSLVYVTALAGGERILAASALEEEENTFAGITDLALPPSRYLCVKRNFKMQQVDMNRITCRYEQIWDVFLEDPAVKMPAASAEFQRETVLPKQPPLTVIRKKPGEKWLKQAGPVKLKTAAAKLVITVRK